MIKSFLIERRARCNHSLQISMLQFIYTCTKCSVHRCWICFSINMHRIQLVTQPQYCFFIDLYSCCPIFAITNRATKKQFTFRRSHTVKINRMRAYAGPNLKLTKVFLICRCAVPIRNRCFNQFSKHMPPGITSQGHTLEKIINPANAAPTRPVALAPNQNFRFRFSPASALVMFCHLFAYCC